MPDRRQQRTRTALQHAILTLLPTIGYSDLTIQHIADQAGVARKTFYAHYANKAELLHDALDHIFTQLATDTATLDADSLLAGGRPLSYPVFAHVAHHADLYRALFHPAVPADFVLELVSRLAAESYQRHAPLRQVARHITVDPHLIAHHLAGALLGSLRWWLGHNCAPPAETMAYTFSQLAAPGVLAALGIDS